MQKYFWLAVGILVGMMLVTGVVFTRPYTLRGSLIDNPVPAPEISLVDANGQPFVLSEYRGRIVLLFFGYTSCPDVCPATLGSMKELRLRLGKKADQVTFVFISVDPARDTAKQMRTYLGIFDPAIIGLTGSEADLQPIWQAYGVYREVQKADPTAAGYLVAHTSRTYLVDRQGRLRLTYAFGTPIDDIEQDVRYLLKE